MPIRWSVVALAGLVSTLFNRRRTRRDSNSRPPEMSVAAFGSTLGCQAICSQPPISPAVAGAFVMRFGKWLLDHLKPDLGLAIGINST